MRRLFPLIFVFFLCRHANAGAVLTLIPSNGIIAGNPGTTVGWGFTITNSSDYVVMTGAQFCGNGSAPPFCDPLSPSLGTFTDFTGAQFLLIGPSPESISVTQSFDNAGRTGVGSFSIDSGAVPGSVATGLIELTYDLFSVTPNSPDFNPLTDTISNGNFLTAPAEVDVISAVPEPTSFSLLLIASCLPGLRRVGHRQRPAPERRKRPHRPSSARRRGRI